MEQKIVRTEDLPWMPLGKGVCVRLLRLDGKERTLQLRVAPGVLVDRHVHAGDVHAFNVSGFRELDTGEVAGPGDYVYEPAGNIDWWRCVGTEHCVVQITMSGRLTYLGAGNECLDWTDTPRLRAQYLAWCARYGYEPAAIGAIQ